MDPTIVDVAAAAGVSKSTAGRALSGHPAVREETRQRVLDVAAKLGYRANPAARALRGGTSRLIGLVITNLVNASIQTIAETVHALAHEHGYQVLMAVTEGDPRREGEVVAALVDHRIDGLIIMSSARSVARLQVLASEGVAVVNLIRHPQGIRAVSVLDDDLCGAKAAADYLLHLGHERIAFVGGPLDTYSGEQRFAGYCDALGQGGVELDQALVRQGPFVPEWGAQAAADLLDGPAAFSALLVANHEALSGIVQVLARRGIDVPGELSLVGFEDAPLFRYWHPSITVVDTQPERLGVEAFELLSRQLSAELAPVARPEEEPRSIVVPSVLRIRESCRPLTA